MTSIIQELEQHELQIEAFLVVYFNPRRMPSENHVAHLRMLVGEYMTWHELYLGVKPPIHPIHYRFKFLQMRKRKSKIPISAVA